MYTKKTLPRLINNGGCKKKNDVNLLSVFCFYLLYCICAKCKPIWLHQMISQKPNRIWENKYVCTVYVLSTCVFCSVRQIFIPDFVDILFARFIFFYDLVNQMCCMSFSCLYSMKFLKMMKSKTLWASFKQIMLHSPVIYILHIYIPWFWDYFSNF